MRSSTRPPACARHAPHVDGVDDVTEVKVTSRRRGKRVSMSFI